jgi:dihydrodipicolinate synthase/N-acetylneuraminate lyase
LRDGAIDYTSLHWLIDHNISAGSSVMLLTYGDSLFSLLTDQEVADLTRVVVEQTARRALVVAADRQWWTGKMVSFARYAVEIGADMLMVLSPDWGASCTVRSFVEHYAAVAAEIPVMVVTNVFRRSATLGLETLRTLCHEVPGVVAVKDDLCGEFARKMALLVHDQWAVISGGQKQNHLDVLPYGCDGYLSTFVYFSPTVTHRYLDALATNDWEKAKEIIRLYDMPYFELVLGLPGGFDAGFHATLELFGLAQRWRRPPFYFYSL